MSSSPLLGLEENESEVLYRVCIGAYREKNNAIKQVELAKERGFRDTDIVKKINLKYIF